MLIKTKDFTNAAKSIVLASSLDKNATNLELNAKNNTSLKMYLYLNDMRKKLSDKRLNKELFMTNILTNLWRLVRE